jgi:EAL domain-containing protein (putative c-di-GMP-specific phosphodiesterase class I)
VADTAATPVVPAATWARRLDRACRGIGLNLLFQPIVDLQRAVVVGYETLARFDDPPGLTPDVWFAEAERHGRVDDLDAAVLARALATRASLPRNTFLTVNVEPESLLSPKVMGLLRAESLAGIAVEVTEHRELGDRDRVRFALEQLRANGALIAVDDAGAGYAGLQQILTMRPQILKVDRAIVDGVDRDEAKAALIEMLGVFANRIDAWVLAEGIETVGEARRCRALGLPLAQGWLFGRPAPPWAAIDPAAAEALTEVAGRAGRPDLRGLLDVTPSMSADALGEHTVFGNDDFDHVVVLDRHDRPSGVVTPLALLSGELLPALIANVDSSPADLAHRLATTGHDLRLPVVVIDGAGRYLGTVRVTRLLAALAGR